MWNLLKVNSRDCVSLLTLFKCFSGILWTCLCLLWCFNFYDFYFDVFIVFFKTDFTPWSTFYVISFKHELSHLLGWFKLKNISKSSFSIFIWKGSGKGKKQELEVFCGKRFFSKPERKKFIYLHYEYYKHCWCMKTLLNVIKVLLIQTTPLVSLLVSTRIICCSIWYLSETWKPTW